MKYKNVLFRYPIVTLTMKTVVDILQRLINSKKSKGRKPKPGSKDTFVKLIKKQMCSKQIVTCGIFQLLPRDVSEKIHNKQLISTLTKEDIFNIFNLISKNKENKKCFVFLTNEGEKMIDEFVKKPELFNTATVNLRTMFNTQERQLVLG